VLGPFNLRGRRYPWRMHDEMSSCRGKARHKSKRGAREEARLLAHRYGSRVQVYACAWCDGWHIGRG